MTDVVAKTRLDEEVDLDRLLEAFDRHFERNRRQATPKKELDDWEASEGG